jgi:hypothetical protein
MSRLTQFDELSGETAEAPSASPLLRVATTALQVMVLTLATAAAGFYVFPLQ